MSGLFSWSGSSMYPGKAKEVIFDSMPCRVGLLRLICMFSLWPLEGAIGQIKRKSHCPMHLGK